MLLGAQQELGGALNLAGEPSRRESCKNRQFLHSLVNVFSLVHELCSLSCRVHVSQAHSAWDFGPHVRVGQFIHPLNMRGLLSSHVQMERLRQSPPRPQ